MGIVQTSFLSFLFSDRRALPYWGVIFSIVCIFAWLSFFVRNVSMLYVFLQKAVFFLVYIGFYTLSYYNYRRYFVLKDRFSKENINFKTGECFAEIHPSEFTIKPMKQNYDARVKVSPYRVTCLFLQLNSGIFLFYSVLDMGVFMRYTKPLFVWYADEPLNIKGTNSSRIITDKELSKSGDSIEISFKKRSEDVDKIVLTGLPARLLSTQCN